METGSLITKWIPDLPNAESLSSEYASRAHRLRKAIFAELWDDKVGAFKESPDNTSLYPQDANSMALAFGVARSSQCGNYSARISDYLTSRWTPIGPHSPELKNNVSPFISSIELEAHYRAGRPDRAVELTRDLWGWYINHPNGTQSTTPEGFLIDGSWGYRGDRGYRNDPSYMSHAHGWSSGPTSTLTEHMLGLRLSKPAGVEWQFKPAGLEQFAHLEGGFTTKLGRFSGTLTVKDGQVHLTWDVPKGTRGWVQLPGQKGQWVTGGTGSSSMDLS